jgi:threonine dehydrogenase-like Zn-dependent dehydrogenase
MRATIMHGPGDVLVENIPDPKIIEPTDAIMRTTYASICGSDLWPYRGYDEFPENGLPMGHEAIGSIREIGSDVHQIKKIMISC